MVVGAADWSATDSHDGHAVSNDNELAYIVVVVVVVTGCVLSDSDDASARRPRIIVVNVLLTDGHDSDVGGQ